MEWIGLTNGFHVNIGSERAQRYNDISVHENHHITLTLSILDQKECAILDFLPVHVHSEVTLCSHSSKIIPSDPRQYFSIDSSYRHDASF